MGVQPLRVGPRGGGASGSSVASMAISAAWSAVCIDADAVDAGAKAVTEGATAAAAPMMSDVESFIVLYLFLCLDD